VRREGDVASVRELARQIRDDERRAIDDSPRRSRAIRSLTPAIVALTIAAQFWLFLYVNPDGPFSTIDDNFDEGWVRAGRFGQSAVVLEDGRQYRYAAETPVPTALVDLRPGVHRVRNADGTAGAWRRSELGLFVDVNDGDAGACEITVWHSPSFAFSRRRRTWNPFAEQHAVWRVHHSAAARLDRAQRVGSDR
jgi:hypothetical protein